MTKLVLTTFAAVAIAGPALAATPLDFTWEGHKIVASVDQIGRTQVIKGHDFSTGRAFELHVKDGFVHGEIEGQVVAYPAPKRKLATVSKD